MSADAPLGVSGEIITASDRVHCYGVCSCKCDSGGKTTEHAFYGQNACKGLGMRLWFEDGLLARAVL